MVKFEEHLIMAAENFKYVNINDYESPKEVCQILENLSFNTTHIPDSGFCKHSNKTNGQIWSKCHSINNEKSCLISKRKLSSLSNEKSISTKNLACKLKSKHMNDFNVNFVVNVVTQLQPSYKSASKNKSKGYRCQFSPDANDSCGCACNSDALFEVMKGLYDCYKKKNCENCKCILCSHLPREERKQAELRKSRVSMVDKGVITASAKERKEPREDLPPSPKTASAKSKYQKAEADGKLKAAKDAGFLTPLEGKTPEQKEKILKGLAASGIPLPEGKTKSERSLITKVRKDLALPPEPKTRSAKSRLAKAQAAGLVTPLEGKTPEQKEKILSGLTNAGIPLPEGRTPSETALIDKIQAKPPGTEKEVPPGVEKEAPPGVEKEAEPPGVKKPSAKSKATKDAGFLTPLEGKTPEQKEKILKGLAASGIPLPEGKTKSERSLITKVRKDLALPPEPKTRSAKSRLAKAQAAGLVTPLEGKTPEQKEKILSGLANAGIPLPEGRTPSEKALIDRIQAKPPGTQKETPPGVEKEAPPGVEKEAKPPEVKKPSAKSKAAKDAGFLTPLEGKTPEQKEKILKGLAASGIPLPEGKTKSERSLITKVRKDLALPPEPKTRSAKSRLAKAQAAGLVTPLEGKTPEQKEKILSGLANAGIPLPEGRTPSEKALIDKIQAKPPGTEKEVPPGVEKEAPPGVEKEAEPPGVKKPSAKSKAAKEPSIPAPPGVEKEAEPPGVKKPSAKSKAAKEPSIPAPPGVEKAPPGVEKAPPGVEKEAEPPGVKIPSAKLKAAKDAGFLTPLEGKTPDEKEKILKGLAASGIPLPVGKTKSEKSLISKVRKDLGLPPEPKTRSAKSRFAKAQAAGLVTPLEGKTPEQKEKLLCNLADAGIPLPEGRTPSEKALIDRIQTIPPGEMAPCEKLKVAKAAGFITPLQGKTPEQKENILRGLGDAGIPLPEPQTPSEKILIDKVRADIAAGKRSSAKLKVAKKAEPELKIPTAKLKAAKEAGLLSPLGGKSPEQKEKIIRGLATNGIPFPEGKTPSEKSLINKVRKELGLPPEPKTPSMKEKMAKAHAAGLITPLEGKTPVQKEKILRGLAEAGIPLPEGRTPSEKALIDKIQSEVSEKKIPPAKLKAAKAAGLLTPLKGKTPEQKEKILRGLAQNGLPLPEGQTPSEKALIYKVMKDLEPSKVKITNERISKKLEGKTPSQKLKIIKKMVPCATLKGKTPEQKENILRGLADFGIPLPEPQTHSEKALIDKIKSQPSEGKIPTAKLKAAKDAGFLTPLEGKTPEQKEKILKGLAASGIPLPEGKTKSEKSLIKKVRKDVGLPSEPETPSMKKKQQKAYAAGLITPLEGKTPEQKAKTLRGLRDAGIPLPEGRTKSEKSLIDKIKKEAPAGKIATEKLKEAKAEGLSASLEGKTPEQKESIIRGLAKTGMPLPEPKTPSEKALVDKVRKEMGLPPEPKTPSQRQKLAKAQAAGFISPLEGKTLEQKEKNLRALANAGIPLPEGRTPSEEKLIDKIRAEIPPPLKLPSEKVRSAKAAGLLTPLEGKTPSQKDKILRDLAKAGLPLPSAKSPSDKTLIKKVRHDLGLPQSPKSASMQRKMKDAQIAGLITPLEGKTPSQKEKILRNLQDAGIPLPEGRTPSEKVLIDSIKATVPGDKSQKAKAAGLLTPLDNKTPAEKEKILRGLAQSGIPLPEGKTPSEKDLINKVRKDLDMPPEPKSASLKDKTLKAHADHTTPLEGKTPSQKAKTLKTKAAAGEKKSRTKAASIGGLKEEVQEIEKTTVCEKACGCDKKKIRFKHSYVKIRVTSPDISSLCDCPSECLPGVKQGVFTDDEGIKVTVGTALVDNNIYHKKLKNYTDKINKKSEVIDADDFNIDDIMYFLDLPLRDANNLTSSTSTEIEATSLQELFVYNKEIGNASSNDALITPNVFNKQRYGTKSCSCICPHKESVCSFRDFYHPRTISSSETDSCVFSTAAYTKLTRISNKSAFSAIKNVRQKMQNGCYEKENKERTWKYNNNKSVFYVGLDGDRKTNTWNTLLSNSSRFMNLGGRRSLSTNDVPLTGGDNNNKSSVYLLIQSEDVDSDTSVTDTNSLIYIDASDISMRTMKKAIGSQKTDNNKLNINKRPSWHVKSCQSSIPNITRTISRVTFADGLTSQSEDNIYRYSCCTDSNKSINQPPNEIRHASSQNTVSRAAINNNDAQDNIITKTSISNSKLCKGTQRDFVEYFLVGFNGNSPEDGPGKCNDGYEYCRKRTCAPKRTTPLLTLSSKLPQSYTKTNDIRDGCYVINSARERVNIPYHPYFVFETPCSQRVHVSTPNKPGILKKSSTDPAQKQMMTRTGKRVIIPNYPTFDSDTLCPKRVHVSTQNKANSSANGINLIVKKTYWKPHPTPQNPIFVESENARTPSKFHRNTYNFKVNTVTGDSAQCAACQCCVYDEVHKAKPRPCCCPKEKKKKSKNIYKAITYECPQCVAEDIGSDNLYRLFLDTEIILSDSCSGRYPE